jgi:hypothetical protein
LSIITQESARARTIVTIISTVIKRFPYDLYHDRILKMKRGKVLSRLAVLCRGRNRNKKHKQLQHVSKMQKVADYVKLASVKDFKGTKINCYGILNSIDREVKSVNSKTNRGRLTLSFFFHEG